MDRKQLHPSVLKALEHFDKEIMSIGHWWKSVPAETRAQYKFQRKFQNNRALKKWIAYFWGPFFTFGLSLFFLKLIPLPPPIAYSSAAAVVAVYVSYMYFFTLTINRLSGLEIGPLLKMLGLNDIQEQYAVGLSALDSSNLSKHHKAEIISQMNALLDTDVRLTERWRHLKKLQEINNYAQTEKEVNRMKNKLQSARDDATKAVLQESIRLAEGRHNHLSDAKKGIDRLDAQLELIMQTMIRVTDTISRGLGSTQLGEDAFDDVRSRIVDITQQSEALDKAIQELDA